MKVQVRIPPSYPAERDYIISTLLSDFLGLDVQIELGQRQETVITAGTRGELIVADGLFTCPHEQWLTSASLPQRPLRMWEVKELGEHLPLVSIRVPVIYGKPLPGGEWMTQDGETLRLGLDVFGSSFFMLTRYEEAVKPDRDRYDRFPATSSLAYQENFLDRPIVNEYLEILWACLKRLWPNLERKPREFHIRVGHDVDRSYLHAFAHPITLLRNCAGDVLLRHQVRGALRRASAYIQVKRGNLKADPYNTFDLLMGMDERGGLRSTFHFLGGRLPDVDSDYPLDHPRIRTLLRHIHERGHSLGYHASYDSYRDPDRTQKEFQRLKHVCEKEGIEQDTWGGRQHYLRWQTPITFQNLNDAGLDYDATLSFPEHAGFRCGVCYEYPVFNVVRKEKLRLRERPLIVMDRTITDDDTMGLGRGEKALEKMLLYKNLCRRFRGDFALLWHNTRLVDSLDVTLYEGVLHG